MGDLPKRTTNTMSDAIALSSPSGRMSKRARRVAEERLRVALFGKEGYQPTPTPQPSERERLLAQAQRLRELAERGMCVRKYRRIAQELEEQATKLDTTPESNS